MDAIVLDRMPTKISNKTVNSSSLLNSFALFLYNVKKVLRDTCVSITRPSSTFYWTVFQIQYDLLFTESKYVTAFVLMTSSSLLNNSKSVL